MDEILKQWDLPDGAKVKLSDGEIIEFIKMDGMYAEVLSHIKQWIQGGAKKIGNFEGFKKVGDYYEIVKNKNHDME